MIVVEHGLHLYLRRLLEDIAAVGRILIDGDIAVLRQLEDIGKQVCLFPLWFYGIVKASIRIVFEINLTIDITTPDYILRHIHCRRE